MNALLKESQSAPGFPIRVVDLAALSVKFYANSDADRAMDYAKLIQRNSDQPLSVFVDSETISKLKRALTKSKSDEDHLNADEVMEDIR